MTLRKITSDNSVKEIPQCEQTRERERVSKPNTIKIISLAKKKQNKNISQNNRKFTKNIAAEGFIILEWLMNCYF